MPLEIRCDCDSGTYRCRRCSGERAAGRAGFAVEVPAEERRHLLKMGEKSEEFVWRARDVALENPELMPRGLDLGEFERAAAVRDLLGSLEERLQPLMVRLRDSRTLAGADLMNSAMQVYAAVRANGSGEALEESRAMLAQRFLRETGKRRSETGKEEGRTLSVES